MVQTQHLTHTTHTTAYKYRYFQCKCSACDIVSDQTLDIQTRVLHQIMMLWSLATWKTIVCTREENFSNFVYEGPHFAAYVSGKMGSHIVTYPNIISNGSNDIYTYV